jgi:hypothetical protein
MPSLRRCDPARVGIEEQKENHAESHQVHIDQKENAAVVKAPSPLHASDSVYGSGKSNEGGQDKKRVGVDDREAGDQHSEAKAQENQQNSTDEGSPARVEKAR